MKNSKETYIHGNVLINIRPILDSLEFYLIMLHSHKCTYMKIMVQTRKILFILQPKYLNLTSISILLPSQTHF